jgi:hypothetical protein
MKKSLFPIKLKPYQYYFVQTLYWVGVFFMFYYIIDTIGSVL